MAELTITGTHTTESIDAAPVMPFTGVVVTDPNVGAQEELSLRSLGLGSIGTLTYGPDYAGPRTLTLLSDGDYQITGTDAQVTQELDALVYTPQTLPPGNSQNNFISIEDFSSATNYTYGEGGFAFDGETEVVNSTPPDTVSLSPQVTFHNGVFTLTGTATSTVGVSYVDIQAIVDGVPTDLGTTTVDADGNFSFADRVGRHTQTSVTAIGIDSINYSPARDTAPFSLTGGLGPRGTGGGQTRYTADDSAVTTVTRFAPDGAQRVSVRAGGQTLQSNFFDTFNNGGAPQNTFVFDPGFGRDVINLFRPDNVDHDTLSLKGADFNNDIANVLAHTTRNQAGDAVIHDPTNRDSVILTGITKRELATYAQQDITFHA